MVRLRLSRHEGEARAAGEQLGDRFRVVGVRRRHEAQEAVRAQPRLRDVALRARERERQRQSVDHVIARGDRGSDRRHERRGARDHGVAGAGPVQRGPTCWRGR